MRPSLVFGRIGGIPVGAHWSALAGVGLLAVLLATTVLPELAPGLSAAVYALAAAMAAILFVLSLLAHEVAHALVAHRSGIEVRRITLWLLGGVSELGGKPSGPGVEVRVALAGPLMSMALGGVFTVLAVLGTASGWAGVVVATLSWLATMNVVLAVFNLMPGSPLDGGRVLHGLVWRWTGDRERATRAASGAGQVLGALLAGGGVLLIFAGRWDGLWLVLVGWFLAGSAVGERMHAALAEGVGGLRARDAMTSAPVVIPAWWTVQALLQHLVGPNAPRCRTFPVVDLAGHPLGVVNLAAVMAVPAEARAETSVGDLVRTPPLVLAPDDPVERALERPPTAGRDLVIVADGDRVVGVIAAGDLERVVLLHPVLAPGSHPRS